MAGSHSAQTSPFNDPILTADLKRSNNWPQAYPNVSR